MGFILPDSSSVYSILLFIEFKVVVDLLPGINIAMEGVRVLTYVRV